jgi:hypothetical protein
MVDELDASIARVLDRELPKSVHPTPVSISFATPSVQFPPDSLTLPAINFFLYDLQQNLGLRRNDPVIERTQNGSVRRAPWPALMDASYLVTVWTDEKSETATADEHRIFTAVVQVLMAHPTLPVEDLGESMKEFNSPTCAVGSGMLQNLSQAWQALAGRQKLSTTFTVTFSMPVVKWQEVTIVTDNRIELGLMHDGGVGETEVIRHSAVICGTVFDCEGTPVPAAHVLVQDAAGSTTRRTTTRADGTYYFLDLPNGRYVVSASLSGVEARQTGAVTRNDQGNIEIAMIDLKLATCH